MCQSISFRNKDRHHGNIELYLSKIAKTPLLYVRIKVRVAVGLHFYSL